MQLPSTSHPQVPGELKEEEFPRLGAAGPPQQASGSPLRHSHTHTPLTAHPDPLCGSGLPRGRLPSRGCPGPTQLGRLLKPTPRPGQRPPGRKREGGGSGGRSLRTAAAAPGGPGPPAARSARPDPCHGPPRSPSCRRPRPPHPNGREGPVGTARTAAARRGSAAAPGAPGCAGKGRQSRRGRGLTGQLPPLPGTAVRYGRPGWKPRLPSQRFRARRRRRERVLREHRWEGVPGQEERRGGGVMALPQQGLVVPLTTRRRRGQASAPRG